MRYLISLSFLLITVISCNDSSIDQNNVEIEHQLDLRADSCPWCIYADVKGGLQGGTVGTALGGPIGGMFLAVGIGFLDSYHEYYGLVDGNPNETELSIKLDNIDMHSLQVVDSEFNEVGRLHNKIFASALRKEFLSGDSFQSTQELVEFVIDQLETEEIFKSLNTSDVNSLKNVFLNYIDGENIELSNNELEYLSNITNSDFHIMNETDMVEYVLNSIQEYNSTNSIRNSLSIAYYTYYFWNEILE